MNAPATAPTGPNTTAPDTAPKAALPARSCALASNEKNDPAITTATSALFIAISLSPAQRKGLRNCGGTKEMWRQVLPDSKNPLPIPPRGYFEYYSENITLKRIDDHTISLQKSTNGEFTEPGKQLSYCGQDAQEMHAQQKAGK
jgi:hypothetical protein